MTPKPKPDQPVNEGKENNQNVDARELSFRFLSPTRTSVSTNQKTPNSAAVPRSQSEIAAMKERSKRKSEVRRTSRGGVKTPTTKRQKNGEQKQQTPLKDKPSATKVFCNEEMESFTSVIWPVLQKLGFRYTPSSGYRHPYIAERFENAAGIRNHLCSNGIPNITTLKDADEKQKLKTWTKFAHVPLTDWNSAMSALGSLKLSHEVLPDEEIQQKVLPALGFEIINDMRRKLVIMAPGASDLPWESRKKGVHYFLSLDEVRVYVRSHEILAVADPNKVRIRSRKDTTTKDERSQERLWIRLWGATSKEDLPVFHGPTGTGNPVVSSPNQQSPSRARGSALAATLSPEMQRQGETTTLPSMQWTKNTSTPNQPSPRARASAATDASPEMQQQHAKSTPPSTDQHTNEVRTERPKAISVDATTPDILNLRVSRIAIGKKVFHAYCQIFFRKKNAVLELHGYRNQRALGADSCIAKINFLGDFFEVCKFRLDGDRSFLAMKVQPTEANKLSNYPNAYQIDSGDKRKSYVLTEFHFTEELKELLDCMESQPASAAFVEEKGLTTDQALDYCASLIIASKKSSSEDTASSGCSKEAMGDVFPDGQAANRGRTGEIAREVEPGLSRPDPVASAVMSMPPSPANHIDTPGSACDSVAADEDASSLNQGGAARRESMANQDQRQRSAVFKYRALRVEIMIQRKLRNANKTRIGLGTFEADPIPATAPDYTDQQNQRLQRQLDHIRLENELLLQQSPIDMEEEE